MQNPSNNSQVLVCAITGGEVKSQAAALWSGACMPYTIVIWQSPNELPCYHSAVYS